MDRLFFIVGPTATGKSEIAAAVARACDAEVVSADAFQIYAGLDLLTAKPDAELLTAVPHHLIGTVPLSEAMDAEQFRTRALAAIDQIHLRGRPAIVVGGSGMYVKALTHGLSTVPRADPVIRAGLEALTTAELHAQLAELDPAGALTVDQKNRRRLIRALEICRLSGAPASAARTSWKDGPNAPSPSGVFVQRDRAELYQRINSRVETMFANGVIDEVRAAGELGRTAAKTLGLATIQQLIAGNISERDSIAAIQQATRRYAKRQLTWFAGQTNFEPLNLTEHGFSGSIELITRKARLSFTPQDV